MHLIDELKKFKKMRKLNVVMKSLMVVGALFLVSCNTDDGISCPEALTGELDAAETEFSGDWTLTALEADDAVDITDDDTDNPTKDIFAQYTECQSDLVYEFMDDRNYAFKQGYVAADCEGKGTFTGTWALTANVLTLVSNCASQRVDIEMNADKDVFSYDTNVNVRDVNGAVKTTKVTYTYTKAVGSPE